MTGSHPEATGLTLAGTTHHLPLTTVYYTASVPIWLDLISAPEEWATSFLAPEAREVLAALGGVVVVFPLAPPARELLSHVGRVVQDGFGDAWDGVGLAVGVGTGPLSDDEMDDWDGVCVEAGLEFVLVAPGVEGPNEFGGEVASAPRPSPSLG